MEELNFTFTLYAFDRRPALQIKQLLEDQFGCVFSLEKADRPAGIERVLSKEEFATENRERFPELYRDADT